MSNRSCSWMILAGSVALAVGCADAPVEIGGTGEGNVELSFRNLPPNKSCVVIDVVSAGEPIHFVEEFVPIAVPQLVSFKLLPGPAKFTAVAYDVTCNADKTGPSQERSPDWIADPVTLDVRVTEVATLDLVLHRPGQVEGEIGFQEPVEQIAAGDGSTYAIMAGKLWAWGNNSNGQVGLFNPPGSPVAHRKLPGKIDKLEGVTKVAAGRVHVCAIASNATSNRDLFCWGAGGQGQIGVGTNADYFDPQKVLLSLPTLDVAAGTSHTCVIQNERKDLRCWGGGLGNDAQLGPKVTAPAGETFVALAAGDQQTCALRSNGKVRCWKIQGTSLVQMTDITASASVGISMGSQRRSVLRADGGVFEWDGEMTTTPTNPLPASNSAVHVSTGGLTTCAVRASGQVRCWGKNDDGQLGNGTGESTTTSVAVIGIDNAVEVAVNHTHACALTETGLVYCWGNNTKYALGQTDGVSRFVPTRVDFGPFPPSF